MPKKAFLWGGDHEVAPKKAQQKRCVMEFVSYLAGQSHSDCPNGVAEDLNNLFMGLNDSLGDDQRQLLLPLSPRLLNTEGYRDEEERAWQMMDFLVRTYAPVWLEKAGYEDAAARLRGLSKITNHDRMNEAVAAIQVCQAELKDAPSDYEPSRPAAWNQFREKTVILIDSCVVNDPLWTLTGETSSMVRCAYGDEAVAKIEEGLNQKAIVALDDMLPPEPLSEPVVKEWRTLVGIA